MPVQLQVNGEIYSSMEDIHAEVFEDSAGDDDMLPKQVKLIKINNQVRRLQTIIRDKSTSRSDFVFTADRLIRLVIEEGLNILPCSPRTVTTSSGLSYLGLKFDKGNGGVSIIRSGEAMEQGLQDCCRSIRIGKILIQSDEEDPAVVKLFYSKLPKDIASRNVLLMYPILSSGSTVLKAIEVLNDHHVPEENIILLTLFITPEGVKTVVDAHPAIRILSTELDKESPLHFGRKYFGTE